MTCIDYLNTKFLDYLRCLFVEKTLVTTKLNEKYQKNEYEYAEILSILGRIATF